MRCTYPSFVETERSCRWPERLGTEWCASTNFRTVEQLSPNGKRTKARNKRVTGKKHTTLERLVLLRDLDDRRSVLQDRNFAGRAEVGIAGLFSLPARNAALMTQPADRRAKVILRSMKMNVRTYAL